MDEHVEEMVKQFAMTNSSPSTCVRMLHRMDDRLYDVHPDTNAVIVIHDPSSALIGGRQKGRPNKKRENHVKLLPLPQPPVRARMDKSKRPESHPTKECARARVRCLNTEAN
jgi:hypothetical protein